MHEDQSLEPQNPIKTLVPVIPVLGAEERQEDLYGFPASLAEPVSSGYL